MPLLYSLGQHRALEAINREMRADQHLTAFLDDIFLVTMPQDVGAAYAIVQEKLWVHSCNRAGIRPLACDVLEGIARIQHPSAVVWRGSDIPTVDQGIRVFGTPLGHPDHVARHLHRVQQEQQILLDRIPSLLLHCASACANYQLRVVHPSAVEGFVRRGSSCRARDGLETPAGWCQVIRGPRPKLAPGQQWSSSSSWWQYGGQRDARTQKPQTAQRRWQRCKIAQGPEEVQAAATHRAAGECPRGPGRDRVCGGTEFDNSVEGSPPRSAGSSFCCPNHREAFIQRSQNRLRQMEAERVAEQTALDGARARLSVAGGDGENPESSTDTGRRDPTCRSRNPPVRARLAKVELERDTLKKRARSLSQPSSDLLPALQSMNVLELQDRRSATMQTLMDHGSSMAASNNRFSPLGL